ncbi:hypothetical protein V8E52_011204 [Russula decolorans]
MTALDGVNGTVCNAQQYDQSQEFRNHNYSGPSISCLTHGESIGLAIAAEASFISSISVIVIFFWIGWNVRWYRKTFPKGDWKLIHGPADVYMFSLFVFEFLQAMGGVLDVRWAHRGIVTTGHYCMAQGVIQQIGEVGVALITLLLAVHTFVAALWRVGLQARGVALGMVYLACIFITLWVAIGASSHKNYDTPTPYWCWISPKFSGIRLGGEYLWLWIALFASAILYIPLYFWTEGRLSVDEESWYKFHMSDPDQRVEYAQRRAALRMLLYPLAYSLVVLPLSISRWLQFSNHNVSSAATFFGVTMFNLSGAINVLLFLVVRPQLLLFPRPEELAEPDMELAPPQGTSSAIFSDIAKFQHSPEPTSAALVVDEGSRNSAAQSRASSRRISDEI